MDRDRDLTYFDEGWNGVGDVVLVDEMLMSAREGRLKGVAARAGVRR